MKTFTLSMVMGCALAASAAAQSTSGAQSASQPAAASTRTVFGCVEREAGESTAMSYKLKDVSNTAAKANGELDDVRLVGGAGVDLAKFVGQKVEVSGMMSAGSPTSPTANVSNTGVPADQVSRTAPGSAATGEAGQGVSGISNNGKNVTPADATMSVTAIKMVAATCS